MPVVDSRCLSPAIAVVDIDVAGAFDEDIGCGGLAPQRGRGLVVVVVVGGEEGML